jgi:hypothetical protein
MIAFAYIPKSSMQKKGSSTPTDLDFMDRRLEAATARYAAATTLANMLHVSRKREAIVNMINQHKESKK